MAREECSPGLSEAVFLSLRPTLSRKWSAAMHQSHHSVAIPLLKKIHPGHQGITKCREFAKLWLARAFKGATKLSAISESRIALRPSTTHLLVATPTALPELPLQKVASNMFEWETSHVPAFGRLLRLLHRDRPTQSTYFNRGHHPPSECICSSQYT